MNTFPGFSALFLVSFASATLFACAAPAGGEPDSADVPEVTGTATEPLLGSCVGTYTRASANGEGAVSLLLEPARGGKCKAGELHLGGDHTLTLVATGETVRGSWSGDANAFVLCTGQHCEQWQRTTAASER